MEEGGSAAGQYAASAGGESDTSSVSASPSGQLYGGGASTSGGGDEGGTPGTAGGGGGTLGSPLVAGTVAAATADGIDPKKLRACEACRGLKVRCEPDPNEGPCKRCKKAGRSCVVTAPTRKRQKKTDSRVSELEKKIDALTASLQARTGGVPPQQHNHNAADRASAVSGGPSRPGSYGGHQNRGQEHRNWETEIAPWDSNRPPDQDSPFQQLISMAGRKRKAMEGSEHPQDGSGSQQGGYAANNRHATKIPDDDGRPSAAAASVGWPAYTSRAADGDAVDRGLVPMELAARLFSRYKTQMVRHLPGVVFPPSTTIAELRRTKPILFLAIMAAASGEDHALQRVLQKELMQIFAQKIIVTGEKTMELVQALIVAVIWYWPPEYFEELKFYQLIHIAGVMAIDIGLGRKGNARNRRNAGMATTGTPASFAWRGDPSRKVPPPDPTSLEARRTWLTCYYLAANTAMSLHRPNLIRWTSFMAESMEVLETNPDAAPTDKYFCHLVWTHQLGEQIGTQLSMDDLDTVVDIADARTQYALRALERDLERYRAGVPRERQQATLRISFDLLNLFMHETVLHVDAHSDEGTGFNTENLQDGLMREAEPLSAQHINALTSCLTAINGIFETFLGLEIESIRCLPVFNFVRVAYAVVVLMKMYFSASTVGSDFGQVFTRESMRVQQHLDALLEKFRATAADDKCRPASKFLVVLAMLRSWFVKQGKTDAAPGTASSSTTSAQDAHRRSGTSQQTLPQQQHQYHQQHTPMQAQTANTPLQLLSEVATSGDPSSNNNGGAPPFVYYRQPAQPFFHDSGNTGGAATSSSGAAAEASSSAGPMMGGSSSETAAASNATLFPPWITEAMLGNGGFDGVEFPTASLGIGAADGFEGPRGAAGAGGAGMGGVAGTNSMTNDQFWTDMFQGIPDPNMFTF